MSRVLPRLLIAAGLLSSATAFAQPPAPPPSPPFAAVPEAPSIDDDAPPPAAPLFAAPEVCAGLPAPAPFIYLKKSVGRYTRLSGSDDRLGMDIFDLDLTFALRDVPQLTAVPGGGINFLSGPQQTDLPARLYNAQFDVRWFGQINRQFAYEVAATPSLFTDGDNVSSDAFRMMGRGLLFMFLSERTQLVGGIAYLDRRDVPALPVVGVIHKPSDDLAFELVFPKPRALKRIGEDVGGSTWMYAAGEFGGGSYAIRRAGGRPDDVATLRDYRFLLGLERRKPNGWTTNVELGYVFGREVEYERGAGGYSPDPTFLLRLVAAH